jgi:hypothetical protein
MTTRISPQLFRLRFPLAYHQYTGVYVLPTKTTCTATNLIQEVSPTIDRA